MISTLAPSPIGSTMSDGTMTSSVGLLALLEEEDITFQIHALKKLHVAVDHFWAEIADSVGIIEALSEDESFPERELAASVASKVFYNLDEMHEALRLALSAGAYFDINAKTQYVETLIAKCIDEYTTLSCAALEKGETPVLDPRLVAIVDRMCERCYEDGEFKQALGVALQAWNLEKVEESIKRSDDQLGMLRYCSKVAHEVVTSRVFRLKVLRVIVDLYYSLPVPDYLDLAQCLQYLDDSTGCAKILDRLIRSGNSDDELIAYQVAFDLVETENQQFLVNTIAYLPAIVEEKIVDDPATESKEEVAAPVLEAIKAIIPLDIPEYWGKLTKLLNILNGNTNIELNLHFLWSHNKSDLAILRKIKTLVEGRNSVTHHATVMAHGFTHAGTTVDTFLRENLTWLSKATNWAKFSATASLGVVHKGHMKESKKLLSPYLPVEGGAISRSPYSEGGALLALGLIHANKGTGHNGEIIEYLRNACVSSNNENVQHGAVLGLGLAGMAAGDEKLYEDLKNILYLEQAVAGEAAGLGLGLLFLGRGNDESSSASVSELLAYAHETKHEKIIRGVSLGVAMMMYGQENEADTVIEQMTRDLDPIIRYGAMFTIAMAYVGTGNNGAIKRLLHVAVSDVSNDVRRAAVMCIGFVLFRTPEKVPTLVKLLSESYNPHVRYGACLAIGIACAGTAMPSALDLVFKMLEDSTDFVRQGALLSVSMILMQQTATANNKVKEFQDKLDKILSEKHQTTMTKMGAILASSFLNAGGRNVTISMKSRTGILKMGSVVGLMLGLQYWYWYPLVHLFSLSFTPTLAMGLDKNLQMPKEFSFKCDATPSTFAYPEPTIVKKEEKKVRVETAVLSTTAKSKQKEARKNKGDDAMEVEEKKPIEEKKPVDEKKDIEKPKEPEPTSFSMNNPSRCTPSQVAKISVLTGQRFLPVISGLSSGILLLKDTTPSAGDYALVDLKAPLDGGEASEPDAPEPFVWSP